jgi:Putative zinc-finger
MNHQEATELAVVEKYLLDELSPPVRDAFEEHFFCCPECTADLRATAAFLEAAKRELGSARVVRPALRSARNSWFAFLGKPAFLSSALASLLMIIAYQNIVVFPRSSAEVAGPMHPEIMPSLSLVGGNGRSAATPTIAVGNAQSFIMSVDIPTNEQFSSYVCVLKSASGSIQWTLPITTQLARDTVDIRVPVTKGLGGSYTLVVQGLNSSASGETAIELAHYRFTLKNHE